jgi:hypothetical protein
MGFVICLGAYRETEWYFASEEQHSKVCVELYTVDHLQLFLGLSIAGGNIKYFRIYFKKPSVKLIGSYLPVCSNLFLL